MEKEVFIKINEIVKTMGIVEIAAQRKVCELVGSIYFYGGFHAETPNEAELATLLDKLGYLYKSEDELIAKMESNLNE